MTTLRKPSLHQTSGASSTASIPSTASTASSISSNPGSVSSAVINKANPPTGMDPPVKTFKPVSVPSGTDTGPSPAPTLNALQVTSTDPPSFGNFKATGTINGKTYTAAVNESDDSHFSWYSGGKLIGADTNVTGLLDKVNGSTGKIANMPAVAPPPGFSPNLPAMKVSVFDNGGTWNNNTTTFTGTIGNQTVKAQWDGASPTFNWSRLAPNGHWVKFGTDSNVNGFKQMIAKSGGNWHKASSNELP